MIIVGTIGQSDLIDKAGVDFKIKGFCPYTDKTAKKKARKEMSFLYFIVFIFNIAKIRRNGIRFHRIRYNNMEIRP